MTHVIDHILPQTPAFIAHPHTHKSGRAQRNQVMMHSCLSNTEVISHFLQRVASLSQFLENAQAAFVGERFGKLYQSCRWCLIIRSDTLVRYWIEEDACILPLRVSVKGSWDIGMNKDHTLDPRPWPVPPT